MTETDMAKQEILEQFAADMLISNGRTVERVYDVKRQLLGIDIISNGTTNIDIKHCSAKSCSLGFDLLEAKNYKAGDGSKAIWKKGWFNKKESLTDTYVQYMLVPTNDGRYLLEEFAFKKSSVYKYYEDKMREHNMTLDTDSKEGILALANREKLNNNKESADYDCNFVIKHTVEKDKDNSTAQHLTVFFLVKADYFIKHFKDCRTRYYIVDGSDIKDVKYSTVTEITDVEVKHIWNKNNTRYEAVITRR